MNVAVALAAKANGRHCTVQAGLGHRPDRDEVHVTRLIRAPGVEARAGAAREDRPDPVPPESISHRDRDGGEARSGADPHSGLPVRRGRRLRAALRSRSPLSGSASLPRYWARVSAAKYRGLQLIDPGPAHGAAGHKSIQLQAAERLLHTGQRHLQQAGQLARVRVAQQAQGGGRARVRVWPPNGLDVSLTTIGEHMTTNSGQRSREPTAERRASLSPDVALRVEKPRTTSPRPVPGKGRLSLSVTSPTARPPRMRRPTGNAMADLTATEREPSSDRSAWVRAASSTSRVGK